MPVPQAQIPDVIDQPQGREHFRANVPEETPIAGAVANVADVIDQKNRQADQMAVVKATNQLTDLDNEQLYHPERGLLNRSLGADAPAAADKTLYAYDQERAKIRSSLSNARQQDAFDQASGEHLRTVQRQVFAYEHGQQKQAEAQTYAAAMENANTAAVNTYGLPPDPAQGDPVVHQVAKQEALTRDYGRAQGWPHAVIDAKIAEAKSKTYTSVIDDMLAKENTAGAEALFHEHGMDIDPQNRPTVERALRTASVANTAQSYANEFLARGQGDAAPTRAEFMDRLNHDATLKGDAKLYDAVARRGDDFFSMRDAAHGEEQRNLHNQIMASVAKDPTADPEKSVTPIAWAKLDGSTQESLKNFWRTSIRKDGIVKTDMTSWQSLDDIFSNPLRKSEALAVNMIDYVDKLDQGDYKDFAKRQDKLRDGSDEMLTRDAMINRVAEETMRQNLMAKGKDGTQQAADATLYLRTLRQQIRSNEATTGTAMPEEQVQALADTLIRPTVTAPGILYDTTEKTFKVIAGNKFTPAPRPEDAQQWQDSLARPHAGAFDSNVATLQRWARGVDDLGFSDPNRIAHARAITAAWIPSIKRQQIIDAYKGEHAGATPTEEEIIGTYGRHLKRTTPAAPVAPPRAESPEPDWFGPATYGLIE